MEGPNVPTYRLNEQIRARVEVEVPVGTKRVVAFFKHTTDPYVAATMVGEVEGETSGVTSVLLKGTATVINEAYGEYLCVSLHAEDTDGKRRAFLSVPYVRYRIVRDHDTASEAALEKQAALVSWTWV